MVPPWVSPARAPTTITEYFIFNVSDKKKTSGRMESEFSAEECKGREKGLPR